MDSIRKQDAGSRRVQVRRKGGRVSEIFIRYEDAKRWAEDAERRRVMRSVISTLSRRLAVAVKDGPGTALQ